MHNANKAELPEFPVESAVALHLPSLVTRRTGADLAQATWAKYTFTISRKDHIRFFSVTNPSQTKNEGIDRSHTYMMIQFGFERMGLHRIEAEAMPENSASVRLLYKLGFQEEGVFLLLRCVYSNDVKRA